jgi:alpha-D-ribose 1-methylphosphonate 5-triphosphate synthase subunit PhnG
MNQMLNEAHLGNDCQRTQLPRLLMALPESEVIAAANQFAARYKIEDIKLPQAGLGLMQLKDSALQEGYFLGEIPLATAHVVLTDAQQNRTEGAAQIMHSEALLARAIAIMDAVVSAKLTGHEGVTQLLARGLTVLTEQKSSRKKMLARTRVDFSLLSSAEEDDADE